MTIKTAISFDDKIAILTESVRYEDLGRYSVESLTLRGWRYLVWPRSGSTPAHCQCEHSRYNPGARCIHMSAIRSFIKSLSTPKF